MKRAFTAAAVLALASAMGGVLAHDKHPPQNTVAKAPSSVRIKLPETALIDQDGHKARFKSETVGDRLALITFMYTSCTTACPPLSALFADLQQRLGERVGRDVSLITITVDPVRDTPLRLKAYAAQFEAGPGWRFLSGSKPAVDEVLAALGAYTRNFNDHPSMVLVGDPRTGEWTRFFGFPSSEQVLARVGQLQAARPDEPLAARN